MTHLRSGLACAIALLCAIGCSLPAVSVAADGTLKVATVDERQPQQWALFNRSQPWPLYPTAIEDSDIDGTEAWQTMEGLGVTVAVVDQLVYAEHPDIAENVEPGKDFLTEPEACDAPEPSGGDDHGTLMAGVIAAQRDNGGIVGVAPLAHIMPLRAVDNCGTAQLKWVLAAFRYAGEQRVKVVSASFASDPLDGPNTKTNQDFVDVFDEYKNTLFVVAAGNEGNDDDDPAHPVYPCSTKRPGDKPDIPNLVCVGMTDNRDDAACFGNVGGTSVDLFAPGVSILSTVRPGLTPYFYRSGTSMAVPMVAGAAAIILSAEPRLGPEQVAQRLVDEVDHKGALQTISVAGGRLNAARAAGQSGRLGTGGGESKPWISCDTDHDGFRDDTGLDECLQEPGPVRGCPDGDRDGIIDPDDNCPAVANADQIDADGDRTGNVCDSMPRGDDHDGDGVPTMDDACPDTPGVPPTGCPADDPPGDGPPQNHPYATPTATPTPTITPAGDPAIVSLIAKVSPRKCPKSAPKCTRVAKITVKLSRQAKVALKVEQQILRRGKRVWKRLSVRSLTANMKGSTLTVRGKRGKPRSKYRVTATLSSKAKPKAVNFQV